MRAVVVGALLLGCVPAGAETISIPLGYALPPYVLDQPYRTIKVGNPSVVDVQALTDRTVLLQPKGMGATNLLFLGASGELLKDLGIVVSPTASPSMMQILKPGETGLASMLYRCAENQGCEFIGTGSIPVRTFYPSQSTIDRPNPQTDQHPAPVPPVPLSFTAPR